MPPRFSANLGFLWNDLPLLDRIERAAAAGFPAVELHWPYDTPAEQVRDACARHGLSLLGLNTSVGNADAGDFGLGAVPGREAEFRGALDQSLDYCRVSGARSIHAMAGTVAPADRGRAREVFIDNLRTGAEKAARDGVVLLLEPINQRDKPGYFLSGVDEAADLIEEVGADNLRVMFDVYHVAISSGDVITRLRRHAGVIGHVQIAAVPSRAEPDEGEISYPAIFEALDEIGYKGFIGCEYRPRTTTEAGLSWARKLGVSLSA